MIQDFRIFNKIMRWMVRSPWGKSKVSRRNLKIRKRAYLEYTLEPFYIYNSLSDKATDVILINDFEFEIDIFLQAKITLYLAVDAIDN